MNGDGLTAPIAQTLSVQLIERERACSRLHERVFVSVRHASSPDAPVDAS